jgi:hypothetical protein
MRFFRAAPAQPVGLREGVAPRGPPRPGDMSKCYARLELKEDGKEPAPVAAPRELGGQPQRPRRHEHAADRRKRLDLRRRQSPPGRLVALADVRVRPGLSLSRRPCHARPRGAGFPVDAVRTLSSPIDRLCRALVAASTGALGADPSATEIELLKRQFDYDASQSLEVKDSLVCRRDGVNVYDVSYASPMGGRATAYLVAPAAPASLCRPGVRPLGLRRPQRVPCRRRLRTPAPARCRCWSTTRGTGRRRRASGSARSTIRSRTTRLTSGRWWTSGGGLTCSPRGGTWTRSAWRTWGTATAPSGEPSCRRSTRG